MSAGLLFTACIDNDYDLSDIDTNIRVNVNELVIPVNIDTVKLSNIFDLDEDGQIKVIDGQYVLIDSGKFVSDEIEIDAIRIQRPEIESSVSQIYLSQGASTSSHSRRAPEAKASYAIGSDSRFFAYKASDVSDYIVAIDSIAGNMTFEFNITFDNLSAYASSFSLEGVVLQLPAGMTIEPGAGEYYDIENGLYHAADRTVSGSEIKYTIHASGLDFNKMGGKYDRHNATVEIDGEIFVKEGYISFTQGQLTGSTDITSMPSSLTMRNTYFMSAFDVTEFSGKIYYNVKGVDFDEVELNNLPDFIAQEGTDIRLANPQLYIHLANPLQDYDIYASTGLSITSYPREGQPFVSAIDNGSFVIPNTHPSGVYNFCLSPSQPDKYFGIYHNAIFVKYSSLSNVLSGNGIPSKLTVKIDPVVPEQSVHNFKLGQNLGAVDGEYTFYSPLELLNESVIAYRDTVDGWGSEDLDNLTITSLDINLKVTSNLPLEAVLEGYPIDSEGKQINNVTIEGAQIDANAKDQAVKIRTTGTIKNLDGIIFKVRIQAKDRKVLTPSMNFKLTDVRPCVSGYFEKEL